MEAEALCPQGGQPPEGLRQLGPGHAVLGLSGVVHDLESLPALSQGEHAAGVIAAADGLGNGSDGLPQTVNQGEIVQVDDGPHAVRLPELLRGRVVGGKHDIFPRHAAALRHDQLRQRGAVAAAALFMEQLQNGRGGGGLHGEILPETGIPGEGPAQAAGVLPDAPLVIEVKGRGVLGGDGLRLGFADKRRFHGLIPPAPTQWR